MMHSITFLLFFFGIQGIISDPNFNVVSRQIKNSDYYSITVNGTNSCLDVRNGYLSSGGFVQLWADFWSGSNEIWYFDNATSSITNGNSNIIQPILECTKVTGGDCTSYWGYYNGNTNSVNISIGNNNNFTPTSTIVINQTTTFLPGRQYYVFSNTRSCSKVSSLVWYVSTKDMPSNSKSQNSGLLAASSNTDTCSSIIVGNPIYIRSLLHGKCMDTRGDDVNSEVCMNDCNSNTTSQVWSINYNSIGTSFKIQAVYLSNRCLGTTKGNIDNWETLVLVNCEQGLWFTKTSRN